MSGNYPDVPGPRLAYDRDGTQFYTIFSNSTVAQRPDSEMATINNESDSTIAWSDDSWVMLMFPSPRDLVGWFMATAGSGFYQTTVSVSSDTTTGIDGTWTNLFAASTQEFNRPVSPAYRQSITSANALGVKAIRFREGPGGATAPLLRAIHLYGTPSEPGNRLEFWHPTLDQSLSALPAWLDWGDRARGTVETRQVRLKNTSDAVTANNITVGLEALTDAATPVIGQMQVRYNGGPYAASLSIASLLPGQISEVIDVKQDLALNAVLALWSQRLYATATSWT